MRKEKPQRRQQLRKVFEGPLNHTSPGGKF
jgi:hypothetical protein